MPRSSRHKSHKSKHSSRDYSDTDEDVKMKEKGSSKDENSVRSYRDSASGEKRKIQRDGKDLGSYGNGEASEDNVSSKRRKEKADANKERVNSNNNVGGDRWDGGEEMGFGDRNIEKHLNKGEIMKIDSKSKENNSKGENLRIESKTKSKRYETASGGEKKEETLASLGAEKDEGKSKGEVKRKSERELSGWKEGKEPKDKDRGLEKEKRSGEDSKRDHVLEKFTAGDVGKKLGSRSGDGNEDRQVKRGRDNAERPLQDELQTPESEKELEKRIRRRTEGSSDRDKYYEDVQESEGRRISSRGERAKDLKHRNDRQKDGGHGDKYQEDGRKDDRHRDDKYIEDVGKDNRNRDDKYREDGDRDSRCKVDKYGEDGDRESRRRNEKQQEDGERESRRRDDKYRESTERHSRHRDEKSREESDRNGRDRDERYREDGDKDGKRTDERYRGAGDRDDRHRDDGYREDDYKDRRHKEERRWEDTERDSHSFKQGDDFDREERLKDAKYRDDRGSRDRSGDKLDARSSRDDGYGGDRHYKKSSTFDDSTTGDDLVARFKDDQGRSRTNDKDDYLDYKSRSTKDLRSDVEKKSPGVSRMDSSADRGRSTSRFVEVEPTSNHIRQHGSPGSSAHATRDQYRPLKQEEPKYRDYVYEERVRHKIVSGKEYPNADGGVEKMLARSLEKPGHRDDDHLGELPVERGFRLENHSLPMQRVDKSPSASTGRRHYTRSDVRRSIDVEESAQRSGGSRDAKEYSGKEVRGSRDVIVDVPPGDELSQPDADTSSISSPFARNTHLPIGSKSLPPPPPFRTVADSPLMPGFGQDDTRGKPNSRYRRHGEPNMGRVQGNAWRGLPNWPSPVGNGFMAFPHGPPPMGFHSVMQPFAAPPMFGVRPSMELNHPVPYHLPDGDRYSGPGRPLGWRNLVDDSFPPPLHSWDAGNTAFSDETHIYGRSDWDHSRNLPSGRGWETNGDLWKDPVRTSNMEIPSSEKERNPAPGPHEAMTGQLSSQSHNEQTQNDLQAESTDISVSSDGIIKNTSETPIVTVDKNKDIAKLAIKDIGHAFDYYLSKLDISADLSEPELFNQCTGITVADDSIVLDADDSKILYMEEAAKANTSPDNVFKFSLFAAANDSIFQKAISLYKRQREDLGVMNEVKLPVLQTIVDAEDGKALNRPPSGNMVEAENAHVNSNEVEVPNTSQKAGGCFEASYQELNLPAVHSSIGKSEDLNKEDLIAGPCCRENIVKENIVSKKETIEGSDVDSHSSVQKVLVASASNDQELKLLDSKCGPFLNSDVSAEACEAMMPESVECGSLNLSRIHHSPESTH